MQVDLPVWTIRPNWKGGVLERLEWLTDVLSSDSGVEQRRSVRISPRRSFEITVNPTRADRTYLDLILHRLGSEEWLFPLWHDQARTTDDAAVEATRLDFDNRFREFTDGGYAIIYQDTFTWEVVQIETQDDDGINLAEPLDAAWGRRTKVFPLRKTLIQTETSLKALTSRVGESVLLFQVNEANDYPEAIGEDMLAYAGSPLLTRAPNRIQEITTSHTRLFDEADGEIGLIYRTDTAGRAFAVQSHNWQITGREAQASFRSFLYTLRGRQRMVWLPTFNDDVVIASAALAGAATVSIDDIGMRYIGAGSPIPGRATLWTGSEVVRIATLPPPLVPQEERLGLLGPLVASYAPGASWGFLQAARLDQDTIEIHHNADSEGTFEVSAGFKTFANDRDASGSNFVPIPLDQMVPAPCGVFNRIYVDINAVTNASTTAAGGLAAGITLDGFSPDQRLYISMPTGRPFVAFSPWGVPAPANYPGQGSMNYFNVIRDGDPGSMIQIGGNGPANTYNGYAAARAAFQPTILTGASSYTFYIHDTPIGDNSGGLSLEIQVI